MLSDKKLAQIAKELGKDFLSELDGLSTQEAKDRIAAASGAIKQAADELQSNEKYAELRDSLKAVTAGLREVRKRQNAIIVYCLHKLEE